MTSAYLAFPDLNIPPLTRADRCDSCSARALLRVMEWDSWRDLVFCGHHYRRHEAALGAAGFGVVEDIRDAVLQPGLDASPV